MWHWPLLEKKTNKIDWYLEGTQISAAMCSSGIMCWQNVSERHDGVRGPWILITTIKERTVDPDCWPCSVRYSSLCDSLLLWLECCHQPWAFAPAVGISHASTITGTWTYLTHVADPKIGLLSHLLLIYLGLILPDEEVWVCFLYHCIAVWFWPCVVSILSWLAVA